MKELKPISYIETLEIRQQVLRPHNNVNECRFLGDRSPTTAHFGLYENDQLVSIASIYNEPEPNSFDSHAWRVRGMATISEHRCSGCGDQLLQKCIEYAIENEATYVWCNGRIKAQTFYEKHGFKSSGKKFELPNIGDHIMMLKELE